MKTSGASALGKVYVRAIVEAVDAASKSNGNGHKDSQKDVLKKVREQVAQMGSLLAMEPSLHKTLCTLATSRDEKARVLSALLKGQEVLPITVRLLSLLVRNNRMSALSDVVAAFDQALLESEGGVLGVAESAEPLSADAIRALEKSFSTKLGKRVEFKNVTSPELMAGLRVTVSGVTYDGTLRGQLDRLKEVISV
jgi:F-type H+-transporting ATPase subunit delta